MTSAALLSMLRFLLFRRLARLARPPSVGVGEGGGDSATVQFRCLQNMRTTGVQAELIILIIAVSLAADNKRRWLIGRIDPGEGA